MINVFNSTRNISYFDSIDEFTNYIETTEPYDNGRDNSSHNSSKSFTGTNSFEEALKLCKYGDEKLHSIVNKQSLKIDNIDTVNKIKQTLVNDLVGFVPNVPNYMMGIPNNMIRSNKNNLASKIINIYINLSASAHVSSESITENAAKYVSAINNLEQQGYRCNVYCGNIASMYYNNDKAYYALIVKIKSDREPLNLSKMCFPLCHSSMLRRLSFKWIETIPIDFTHDGYGRPVDDDSTVKSLLRHIFRDINIVPLSISTNEGKVEDVVNVLKEKGMINND